MRVFLMRSRKYGDVLSNQLLKDGASRSLCLLTC